MLTDALFLLAAALLVALNGYFVAAEFAFVKTRVHRLEELARTGRAFAATALWLARRLDATLAACQLGITVASLGLGWVGEPAFARLLEPLFERLGVESPAIVHGVSFAIAFTLITALHLVAGEQVPKIFAIRRPEPLALICAPPLKGFYHVSFPFLWALSKTTSFLLARMGVKAAAGHGESFTEEELRMLLHQARASGELTKTEARLLHAVFEFDDMVCRRAMVPRNEVEYFDAGLSVEECLEATRTMPFTRYPVCEGSLDKVRGFIHTKDLIAASGTGKTLRELLRPPRYVPELMPISRLLKHFQLSRQHMAFVVDEYGTMIGLITLEDVLEQIVGPVMDEFDAEEPEVVPEGEHRFLVLGGALVDVVNRATGLALSSEEADTLSGLLTYRLGRIPEVGDVVELEGAKAHVIEVIGSRATKVRVETAPEAAAPAPSG